MRRGRLPYLRGVLLLVLLACNGSGDRLRPTTTGEFQQHLQENVERARRRYRVPGVAVALVHGGEVVWIRGFGLADRASRRPVTPDTVFQVASISKPVTAWGVLRLAEEGKLELDRSAEIYLSGWRLPPSPYDSRAVTVRRLLSHTAGLGLQGQPGFSPGAPLPTLEAWLGGESGGAGAVRLESEPGTALRYSGDGYALLQLIVEEVSRERFADYMQREVLEPLSMGASRFEWDPELDDVVATPYGWGGRPLPLYRFTAQAAAGLYSTARDLARFLVALAGGGPPGDETGGGSLAAASRELLYAPQPATRGLYGLGFALEELPAGLRMVSHKGANRGWRAGFAALPARGEGVVVLTNSDRGLPLTTDVVCAWSTWASGVEPASCWADRKRRGTVLAVAAVLGLGLLMDGFWLSWALRRGHRAPVWSSSDASAGLAGVRVVLPLGVAALWWTFWYTDTIVAAREGVENFTPVASMPPSFRWLTLLVTSWCLLAALRALLPRARRHRRRAA